MLNYLSAANSLEFEFSDYHSLLLHLDLKCSKFDEPDITTVSMQRECGVHYSGKIRDSHSQRDVILSE